MNDETSTQTQQDTAGVVAPPPLIYLAGLIAGLVLDALLPQGELPWPLRWILGGALVLAGGALLVSFNTAFTRRGTAVEPWKPTTAIVTSGPYRFTRNPAYLGMALLYIGLALLAAAPWALLVMPIVIVVVDRMVIAREERYLASRFGDTFTTYAARVRRWL
jgi:protein-S-isoprenylcysteine O-methyltransferase Ste14